MVKKDDVTHDRTKRKGRKDAKTTNQEHRTCLQCFVFAALRPLRLIASVLFQKPVEPRYGVIELFGVDMESVNGI